MTVAMLEDTMSSEEFTYWGAFCTLEAEEMEAKQKAARPNGSARDSDSMD